jgi:thioredoxin
MNRTVRLILSGVILAVLQLPLSCNSQYDSKKSASNDPVSLITSSQEFKNIVQTTKETLIVVDLYAEWCGPCRILAPVFKELAITHGKKVKFYRVNIDNSPEIASSFQVQGIPYVIFLRNGEMVHVIQGLHPKEEYEKVITACGSVGSNDDCRKNLESTL